MIVASEKSRVAEIAGSECCTQCKRLHNSDDQGVLVATIEKNWNLIDQIVRCFERAVAVNPKSERLNFEICLAEISEIIPSASICDVAYIIALWRGNNGCGADVAGYTIPENVAHI
jgi:hypothetical protein